MKKLVDKETDNITYEDLINKLKEEYTDEEIEEMKDDYGEKFDKPLFDDSELDDIDPNESFNPNIELTKEQEERYLKLLDKYEI